MSTDKYILVGKIPVEEPDLFKWGEWFETAERHVDQTTIGKANVSTVFLGLDHNFGDGDPILFETMIFGNEEFQDYQERYTTWEEAQKGHNRAVEMVKASLETSK